jgi:hypothetical protein
MLGPQKQKAMSSIPSIVKNNNNEEESKEISRFKGF